MQYPSWTGPILPAKDTNITIGKDPLFNNAAAGDLSLKNASRLPAKGYK
jgi:hypothetical protein